MQNKTIFTLLLLWVVLLLETLSGVAQNPSMCTWYSGTAKKKTFQARTSDPSCQSCKNSCSLDNFCEFYQWNGLPNSPAAYNVDTCPIATIKPTLKPSGLRSVKQSANPTVFPTKRPSQKPTTQPTEHLNANQTVQSPCVWYAERSYNFLAAPVFQSCQSCQEGCKSDSKCDYYSWNKLPAPPASWATIACSTTPQPSEPQQP